MNTFATLSAAIGQQGNGEVVRAHCTALLYVHLIWGSDTIMIYQASANMIVSCVLPRIDLIMCW